MKEFKETDLNAMILSDDEIDNIAGGAQGGKVYYCNACRGTYDRSLGRECPYCGSTNVTSIIPK